MQRSCTNVKYFNILCSLFCLTCPWRQWFIPLEHFSQDGVVIRIEDQLVIVYKVKESDSNLLQLSSNGGKSSRDGDWFGIARREVHLQKSLDP